MQRREELLCRCRLRRQTADADDPATLTPGWNVDLELYAGPFLSRHRIPTAHPEDYNKTIFLYYFRGIFSYLSSLPHCRLSQQPLH